MIDAPRGGLRLWLVRRLKTVLAVYVLAAALLPLSHHDIVCHAKSSTHCSTCVIGSSAETAGDIADLLPLNIAHTGDAVMGGPAALTSASHSSNSGRAPPVSF